MTTVIGTYKSWVRLLDGRQLYSIESILTQAELGRDNHREDVPTLTPIIPISIGDFRTFQRNLIIHRIETNYFK